MQVIENIALISINATLLVQLISFLVFMVIFNRIMIRPLRKVMAEREDYMVQARQQIVDIDKSYEEISREIMAQEADARKTAFEIREDIVEAGMQSVRELMNKTKEEIRTLRMTAQRETDTSIAKARKAAALEVDGLAEQMIASLLDRRSH